MAFDEYGFYWNSDFENFFAKLLTNDYRQVSFRYEIIGPDNESKGDFLDVLDGGSVEYGYLNDIKKTCQFTIVENQLDSIDRIVFGADRMLIWCDVKIPDQFVPGDSEDARLAYNFYSFALGVFYMTSTTRNFDGRVVTRDVKGEDLTKLLVNNFTTRRFQIAKGQKPTDVIDNLMALNSLDSAIVPSDEVATNARSWDIGTSHYRIVADLLDMIGYDSLWFDGVGIAQSSDYISPTDRSVDFVYRTNSKSVLAPDVKEELDYTQVHNQWTFAVAQPDKPVDSVTIVNDDPSSPTSTVVLGQVLPYFSSDNEDATNHSQLVAKAKRYAANEGKIYRYIEITTPGMPLHSNFDSATIQLEHTDFVVESTFSEVGWSMKLEANGEMTHKLRQNVNISVDEG